MVFDWDTSCGERCVVRMMEVQHISPVASSRQHVASHWSAMAINEKCQAVGSLANPSQGPCFCGSARICKWCNVFLVMSIHHWEATFCLDCFCTGFCNKLSQHLHLSTLACKHLSGQAFPSTLTLAELPERPWVDSQMH